MYQTVGARTQPVQPVNMMRPAYLSSGSSAPAGVLYLDNGKVKSALGGSVPAGARVLALQ